MQIGQQIRSLDDLAQGKAGASFGDKKVPERSDACRCCYEYDRGNNPAPDSERPLPL